MQPALYQLWLQLWLGCARMGDPTVRCYRVWTLEEEEALRKGVQKHGIGAWEIIRQDALFKHLLA